MHVVSILFSFSTLYSLFLFFPPFFFQSLLLPFQVEADWAEQGDQQQSEGRRKEREKREGKLDS